MENNYKLYINGLDEKMDQGIPEKHIILLTGTPGTMKSSIAYHLLYENAKNSGVSGLYLTLEQDEDNFKYHLSKLGMGEPIEDKLRLFDMSTVRAQWEKMRKKAEQASETPGAQPSKNKELEVFKNQLETLKGVMGFDLLVIDSLPVVEMMFRLEDPREDLFHFFKWLKGLGVTTILISEMTQDSPRYSKHDLDFLADGIIKVALVDINPTTSQRQIQLVKMRGVNHTTNPFALTFKDGAFEAAKVLM